MTEIWKPILGFSRYEASNLGNLRSLNYKETQKVVILKPALSPDGYLGTMLRDDIGKYHSYKVHYWVALAFLGPRLKGYEVNHKNGIKIDNRIDNLEYMTRSENIKHAYQTGLAQSPRGSRNGMARLTEEQVKEIREYVANLNCRYYGRKYLAEQYGISEAHIKDIVTRRRNVWPHV